MVDWKFLRLLFTLSPGLGRGQAKTKVRTDRLRRRGQTTFSRTEKYTAKTAANTRFQIPIIRHLVVTSLLIGSFNECVEKQRRSQNV